MSYYRVVPEGLELRVRVQPRASRSAVEGLHGDRLKIRLTAPPVDDAANQACVAFLAERLGLAKAHVRLASGHKSREKVLVLSGDSQALLGRLLALVAMAEGDR